jgi:hypothetical protein
MTIPLRHLPLAVGAAAMAVAFLTSVGPSLVSTRYAIDQSNSPAPDSVITLKPRDSAVQHVRATRRQAGILLPYLPGTTDDARVAVSMTSNDAVLLRMEGTLHEFAAPKPPDGSFLTALPPLPPHERWLMFSIPRPRRADNTLSVEVRHAGGTSDPIRLPYQHDSTAYRTGELSWNGRPKNGDLAFVTFSPASLRERFHTVLIERGGLSRFLPLAVGALALATIAQIVVRQRAHAPLFPAPPRLLFALLALLFTMPFFRTTTLWGIWDWPEAMAHYHAARQSMGAFQFPLWTPSFCGGTPLWAIPQPYWPSLSFLLAWVFGDILGSKLAIVGALWLGLWGTYRLAVALGAKPLAAIISSIVFMCSGFLALHIAMGQMLWLTLAWLPWTLFCAYRALRKPWAAVPATVFVLLILFEGRVHLIAYLALLLPLFLLATRPPDVRLSAVFRVLSTLAMLFFLLGAVKILPMVDFLRGTSTADALGRSAGTPLAHLLDVFLRRKLPDASVPWSPLQWHEHGAYVGVPAFVLALAGVLALLWTRRRFGIGLLIIGGAFLSIAVSAGGPTLLSSIPFSDELRNPGRAIVIVVLTLALAAGVGAQSLLARFPRVRTGEWAALLLALFVFADLTSHAWPAFSRTFSAPPRGFDTQTMQFQQFSGDPDAAHHIIAAGQGAVRYCPAYLSLFASQADIRATGDSDYRGEAYADGADVEVLSFTPHRLVLKADVISAHTTDLFINQRYDPHWSSPGRTIREDHGRIALTISAADEGKHLTLSYRVPAFVAGAAISGVTAAALLAVYGRSRHRTLSA